MNKAITLVTAFIDHIQSLPLWFQPIVVFAFAAVSFLVFFVFVLPTIHIIVEALERLKGDEDD